MQNKKDRFLKIELEAKTRGEKKLQGKTKE